MIRRKNKKLIGMTALALAIISGAGYGFFNKTSAGIGGTLTGSALGAQNAVQLNWAPPNTSEKYSYRLYEKGPTDNEFQTIPAKQDIKVLNVYPMIGDNLKTWMEDNGYGQGHIKVDKIDINSFNANPGAYLGGAGNWKYDAVYFGAADASNSKNMNDTSVALLRQFIQSGRGFLVGHDSLGFSWNNTGLNKLRDLFNIKIGNWNSDYTYADVQSSGGIWGSKINIKKQGLLTNYPWNIGKVGDVLAVPPSHSTSQFTYGDIWMTYSDSSSTLSTTDPELIQRANFYLETWNNTAMIQTGHSTGQATPDEQKLLANTLFYLAQVTEDTSWQDHKGQDLAAPNAPTINSAQPSKSSANIKFNFSAQDNGTPYQYYVESTGESSYTKSTTPTITVNNATGVKGYAVSVDGNPSGDPGNIINSNDGNFNGNLQSGKPTYIHAKAIDNAGNASGITNYKFEDATAPTLNLAKSTNDWTNQPVNLTASTSDNETGVKNIVLPDNSAVNGTSANYSAVKNGIYTFKSHDWAGNEASKSIDVTNIDLTGPDITMTPNTTKTWVNKGIDVDVSVTDSESGVKSLTLPDGTVVNGNSAKFNVTKNGVYTVKSLDNAGNESTKVIPIGGTGASVNIDTTAPTAEISYDHAYGWSNQNVKVTVKATDKESGVQSIELPDGTVVKGDTADFSVKSDGMYRVTILDNAGNKLIKDIDISNQTGDIGIDKLAPDLDVTSNPADGWAKDSITLTAKAEDFDSGIASLQLPDGTVVTDATADFKVYKDGDYKFIAKDIAGNTTEKTITIGGSSTLKIDKNPPSLNLTVDSSSWTNEDKIIKVEASDAESGLAKIILPDGTETNSASYEFKASKNGTFTFKAVDKVGNTMTKSIDINQIDKSSPNAPDISGISAECQDTWRNTDLIPSIGLSTDGGASGVKEVQYQVTDNATGKVIKDWSTFENGKTIIGNEGISKINFRTISNAGTASDSVSIITKIDKTIPTGTATCDNSQWTSTGTAINVTSSDSLSGIKSITLPDGKEVSLDKATYIATHNGTFSFTIKDNAGNTTQVNSYIRNVDSKKPNTPSITNLSEISSGAWRNTDFKPAVEQIVSSDSSGIKELQYQLVNAINGDIIKDWSTFDYTNTVVSNEGVTKLNIKAVSKAGLDSDIVSTTVRIDKTKPTLNTSNVTPSDSLNTGMDYKIESSDSLSGLSYVLLPDGTKITTLPAQINISKAGDYKIQAYDIAGNMQESTINVSDKLNSNKTSTQLNVSGAIDKWKPSNSSTQDELIKIIKDKIGNNYDVSVNDWKLNPSTEDAIGNATGKVIVKDSNGNQIEVPFNKVIDKELQTTVSAKDKLEANIGNLIATNDTTKEDLINQIRKYVTNPDITVDIDNFDKKNATVEADGKITGIATFKDKAGNNSSLQLDLVITKLAETLEDANKIITANLGKILVDNDSTDKTVLDQVKKYIYTDELTPSIKDFKLNKSTNETEGSATCTIVITNKEGKTVEIPFSGTIAKLDDTLNETYDRINEHLGELKVTNDSTEDDVLVQLSKYIRNSKLKLGIKDFEMFKATSLVNGNVKGFLTLKNLETNESKELNFKATIPEIKVADTSTITVKDDDLNITVDKSPEETPVNNTVNVPQIIENLFENDNDTNVLPKTEGYTLISISVGVIAILLAIGYAITRKFKK